MKSLALSLGILMLPGLALAQERDDQEDSARDEAIFGPSDDEPGGDQIPGDDERDEDIFGPSNEESDEASAGPVDLDGGAPDTDPRASESGAEEDEASIFEDTTSTEDIYQRLAESEDTLAIGGLLFLRYQYLALDEGSPKDFATSSPNFVNLYLDSRPSDRVRFYARARFFHDPSISETDEDRSEDSVALDQLWMKFDIERSLFVTIGKQRIKWGTGRFWNPTDFLNVEALDALNGVSVFDERLGVPLVKLHYPLESAGANLYALVSYDDADSAREIGGALRAEFLLGNHEFSTSVVARRKTPLRLGLDYSGAHGPVDIKFELALQHGVETPFLRGELDTSPLSLDEFDLEGVAPEDIPAAFEAQLPGVLAARQPSAISREDEWLPQLSMGIEYARGYGTDDTIFFGAEYFFNELGYGSADLYPVLFQQGLFVPFYTGRHYAAAYAAFPSIGSWNDTTITLSGLGNLSDESFIARIDHSVNILTYLTFNTFANVHLGQSGEFNFDLKQDPLLDPAIAALIPPDEREQIPAELTEGFEIVGPLLTIGAGLRYTF